MLDSLQNQVGGALGKAAGHGVKRTREVAGSPAVGSRVFKGMTEESLAHSSAENPGLDGLCSSSHLGQACISLNIFRDREREREGKREGME